MNSISYNLTCKCNNKTYPSEKSYNNHYKTKGHHAWVEQMELKNIKVELTRRDNEIISLKSQNKELRELNLILVKRITEDNG